MIDAGLDNKTGLRLLAIYILLAWPYLYLQYLIRSTYDSPDLAWCARVFVLSSLTPAAFVLAFWGRLESRRKLKVALIFAAAMAYLSFILSHLLYMRYHSFPPTLAAAEHAIQLNMSLAKSAFLQWDLAETFIAFSAIAVACVGAGSTAEESPIIRRASLAAIAVPALLILVQGLREPRLSLDSLKFERAIGNCGLLVAHVLALRPDPYQDPANQPSNVMTRVKYVAHAMGAIDGNTYTNSRDAFIENYHAGARYFEVDFCWSRDRKLVTAHDHNEAKLGLTTRFDRTPAAEILAARYLGKYEVMDLEALMQTLARHPDAYLVTDTKGYTIDSLKLIMSAADRAGVKSRVIPQLYHPYELRPALELYQFRSIIFTLYRNQMTLEELLRFIDDNPVIMAVTMPEDRATDELITALRKRGLAVFIHTINDQAKAKRLHQRGVTGIYTDTLFRQDLE